MNKRILFCNLYDKKIPNITIKIIFRKFNSATIVLTIIYLMLFSHSLNSQWIYSNGPEKLTSFEVLGNYLFAGYGEFNNGGGVFLSTNSGNNWIAVNDGLPNTIVSALEVSGNNLFAGTNPNGVYRSSNNGTNWTQVNNGLSNTNISSITISGSDIFAGTFGGGIFHSTNNGSDWSVVNNGLSVLDIFCLSASDSNIFAGTYNGGVFTSSNKSIFWTAANSGLPNNSTISALNNSNMKLFAGTFPGAVYISYNNGANWMLSGNGFPFHSNVRSFAFYGSNIFAAVTFFDFNLNDNSGVSGGVYRSDDNGANWNAVSTGLPENPVVTVNVSGDYLFAGTADSGVWKRPLWEIVSVENILTETPGEFQLLQNYPNPFNPETKISFEISKSSFIKIIVYDILGEEISVLVNDKFNAGLHETKFDGSGLPGGVYFYKLTSDYNEQVRKMLLLK